jgi:methylmalonyl-CoA/ethylmalonyl-CoA epimerase
MAIRTGAEGTLAVVFGSIDHIGVAVADLDAAIVVHRDTYGMPLVHREVIEAQGVEAALLDVGDSHVELLAPLGDDTPVGRFLAKRGPGLHHVAYRVDDVAATLDELRAAGLRLIDEQPRTGIRGSQIAFLHPATAGGVLTELVQPTNVAMDGDDLNQGAGRMKARGNPA